MRLQACPPSKVKAPSASTKELLAEVSAKLEVPFKEVLPLLAATLPDAADPLSPDNWSICRPFGTGGYD